VCIHTVINTGLRIPVCVYNIIHCCCRLNRPSAPSRSLSMGSGSVSDDVMKSLVGRATYDGPVCSKMKTAQQNTTLPDGYIDRLFIQDDAYSMSSFTPSAVPTELDNVSHYSVPQRATPLAYNSRTTCDNQSLKSSSSETQSQISNDSERASHGSIDGISNSGTTHSNTGGGKLESIRRKPNLKKSHRRSSITNPISLRRSLSPQDVIKEGEILNVSPTNEPIHEVPSPVSRLLVVFSYCMICVNSSRVVVLLIIWKKYQDLRSPQSHLQGCTRLCRYSVCSVCAHARVCIMYGVCVHVKSV